MGIAFPLPIFTTSEGIDRLLLYSDIHIYILYIHLTQPNNTQRDVNTHLHPCFPRLDRRPDRVQLECSNYTELPPKTQNFPELSHPPTQKMS